MDMDKTKNDLMSICNIMTEMVDLLEQFGYIQRDAQNVARENPQAIY